MKPFPGFLFLLVLSSLTLSASAPPSKAPIEPQPQPQTRSADPSIGGILFPNIHLRIVGGDSTSDDIESLAAGHHDPNRNGVTLQSLEAGLSLRATEYLEGFVNANVSLDSDDELEAELEEAFLKLKSLPGGFELRGGQFLNRFGPHNATHLHSWSFVDTNLVNARFLGDHGLVSYGGDLTWNLPGSLTSAFTLGVGQPKEADHDHSHGHDDAEHRHEEHSELEGEDALFDNFVVTGRWIAKFDYNDFHQLAAGVSGAFGDNLFGENSWIVGADFEYLWRENGYQAGGDYFRWRTEAMLRNVKWRYRVGHGEDEHDAHDHQDHTDQTDHGDEHHEEDHRTHADDPARAGDDTEFGIYSMVSYGFLERFETSLRVDYVSGIGDLGLEERYRVSPAVTAFLTKERNAFVRVQYNYDHGQDFGDEHSIWVQIGYDWGGPHVR